MGIPVAATQLANLEIGKDGRQVSYRFRAATTDTLDSVRVYFKDGEGYSHGDGGQIEVTIRPDDGTAAHTPADQVLGSGTATGGEDTFPLIAMNSKVPLQTGTLYHIVFTNTSPTADRNFVSINDLDGEAVNAMSDWAVLSRVRGENWNNHPNHLPIVSLNYHSGCSQSQPIVDALSQSGVVSVAGAQRVRETFRILPANFPVSFLAIRVRRPERAQEPLRATLETSDGTVARRVTLRTSPDDGYQWAQGSFDPLVLTGGKTYELTLSSAGKYETFPVQIGDEYGFPDAGDFTGHMEVSSGNEWHSRGSSLQLQFYFTSAK